MVVLEMVSQPPALPARGALQTGRQAVLCGGVLGREAASWGLDKEIRRGPGDCGRV